MDVIENKTFDLERSLYNLKDTKVIKCIFKGDNDGESVLKEAKNIEVEKCSFSLRYPLWHNDNFKIYKCDFDEYSRAPIWYSNNGEIKWAKILSIKALRECNNIKIKNPIEKIHIAIGIIENLCHELVYHKHKDLNYNAMQDEVDKIITNILKK